LLENNAVILQQKEVKSCRCYTASNSTKFDSLSHVIISVHLSFLKSNYPI